MRKSILATLAIGASLALSACGGSTDVAEPGSTSSPNETPVSAPTAEPIEKSTPVETTDPDKTIRGNLIAKVGSVGTISEADAETVKFTVNSIKPGKCTEPYAQAPKNGHPIFVKVTVETTPALAKSSYPKFDITAHDFKFIAKNGTTFNGSLASVVSYGCIPDSETFPNDGMGPAEKASGIVVLDTPAPNGILIFEPSMSYGQPGFEFNF